MSDPSTPTPSPAPPRKTWSVGTLTYTSATLAALFAWLLLGDFAWSMRDRSAAPLAQWYLKHLETPNLLYALIISTFPNALGFVISPIISYKSDRHRGRFGRRIPYLLITTPIAALGMIGMGLCPVLAPWLNDLLGMHSPGEKSIALVAFALFWAVFSIATVAAKAVFGGLVNDVVPQPFIGRFYGLFRAISLLDGIIFSYWIFGLVDTAYTYIFCAIGLLYGIGFLWVCLKVKEGEYPPPPPADPARPGPLGSFAAGARTYARECFTNPYYIGVFIMIMFGLLAFIPVNTFNIPFARSLGMSMETYGRYVAITYLISFVLSYFMGWLADAFHPIRVAMGCLLFYAAVAAWGALYATTPQTFAFAIVLHGVASGCYFTSAASLGQKLYPHSRYAQFDSASDAIGSLATMATGPAVGLLIDATGDSYRYAYAAGSVLALLAFGSALFVHARFVRLGGVRNYVAPE